jgi:hypothetical protein
MVLYLSAGGALSYNGDGVSGIYHWGLQRVSGPAAKATPYVPTAAAAVTAGAPIYYSTRARIIYHASRPAVYPEVDIVWPYVPTDEGDYPLWTIWSDADNYVSLAWNPRAAGDRWHLRIVLGAVSTDYYVSSAWVPVVDRSYSIHVADMELPSTGEGSWTVDVYDRTADTHVERVTIRAGNPGLVCTRLYLGCWGDETGQTDLWVRQVRT